MRLRLFAFVSVCSFVAACAQGASEEPAPPPTPPPRTDAGPRDAGTPRDAMADMGAALDLAMDFDLGMDLDAGSGDDLGVDTDAGAAPDLGVESDAGGTADAGIESDAGAALDAGSDGGADPDAGVDAGTDAGPAGPCTGLGDCSACAGGVCVAGACASPPLTLVYDFESGMLPSGWVAGGAVPWQTASGRAHGGMLSARSGAIGNSQSSTLTATFTVSQPVVVSFWVNTVTETGNDELTVLVDGALVSTWSGTTAWTQTSVGFGAGTHTILWQYSKDASVATGADRVWIDDVTVQPAPPSIGFEDGVLPPGFTTAGAAMWLVDTARAHSGTRAAASGDISDSQQTNLTRTVTLTAASEVSFWYATSSESGLFGVYDALQFRVDGVLSGEWGGDIAWTRASAAVPAGTHVLEWRYKKDASVSSGADRVWIDDVVTGEDPPLGGPVCGG